MKTKILGAVAEFNTHLVENLGSKISIKTVGAFATMMRKIVEALAEEE